MIPQNEIRIGITGMYQGKFVTVEERDIESWIMSADSLEEIPLTPEILDKCEQLNKWSDNKTWSYCIDENEFLWSEGNVYLGGYSSYLTGQCFKSECKYLHQLQNAFKLTGEELKINL